MIPQRVERYSFPALKNLDAVEREADLARQQQLEAAFNNAVAAGLAEGIACGQAEAQIEACQLLEQSRREGLEQGHLAGFAEMQMAAAALREALGRFAAERAKIVSEAEAFCIDIALAIVARMVEVDGIRSEFASRSVQSALKVLAPETPVAIFLNPADHLLLAGAMNGLPARDDDAIATGCARVETGRLVVHSSIDEAFEQIRTAILETKAKRIGDRSVEPVEEDADAGNG
jgi:flagellar biosynthesis/type III secretory pathway protein FliH